MNPSLKEATTPTRYLQRAIRIALLPGLCGLYAAGALAVPPSPLPTGTKLVFDNGNVGNFSNSTAAGATWFSMAVSITNILFTGLQKGFDGGIVIGTAQGLGGAYSHPGAPYGGTFTSDTGAIDTGWSFFGNTGLDFTTSAITATPDSNDPTIQTLDFSGWRVTWNSIPEINMGGGTQVVTGKKGTTTFNNGSGLATLTCNPACTNGSSFTMEYSATVPQGDPSGFGGVPYAIHMTGTLAFPASANTAPTAASFAIPAQQNTATNWTPDVTDPDTSQTLTCTIVAQPTHGTAAVAGSNSCTTAGTYTPTSGYTGPDSFTYKANDGTADSNTATVTVSVTATPPPTAVNDTLPTATGTTPVSMDVTTNDTPGTYNIVPASVAIATQPAHGAAVANGDGTVTYTADSGFSGSDSFTYNVSDDNGTPQASNDATVSVTVQANQPSSSTGTFAPGTLAVSVSNTTGGGLTSAQVGTDSALNQQCVGGCFDFAISGLAGADATVVLPLSAAIPSNPVYRKLIGGTWVDFNTASGTLASAAAISTGPTVCPAPSSGSYHALTAGDYCVRMTIVNGGANDADGADDGAVLDPGGIGVKVRPTDTRTSGSSGCSVTDAPINPLERSDWGVLAGFMVWLGALVRRNQRR